MYIRRERRLHVGIGKHCFNIVLETAEVLLPEPALPFVDNIWTMLNHMDNVENVKGQGYRLKRGKS